jgi:hypothetical protein
MYSGSAQIQSISAQSISPTNWGFKLFDDPLSGKKGIKGYFRHSLLGFFC